MKTLKIHIKGLVQGVGFRPFIYRLALEHDIKGWVENRNDGVLIMASGPEEKVNTFIVSIPAQAPLASNIFAFDIEESAAEHFDRFEIRKSENLSEEITEVSPDIAVCDECLSDMSAQKHRHDYAFTNCTNCGPRFTIIRDLPYDRPKTTMDVFDMCDICGMEYADVMDRRFHAQPVACNHCGPTYQLTIDDTSVSGIRDILRSVSSLLQEGQIVAIKGMGGYHLACDALNEKTVARLRAGKNRDGKPFAVMYRDLDTLKAYHIVGEAEEDALTSWRRPIVIVRNKKGKKLATSVSNRFSSTGAMLPYMPFHHQLFSAYPGDVIVLTSGNIADEPVIIDDQEASEQLGMIADAQLSYNRKIHNRADDSVCLSVNDDIRPIRRSRGFVPSPVHLGMDVEGIFAAGAELVNCFCVGKGQQAILSQHIGDLKNLETLEFYTEARERFSTLFKVSPTLIVHDLHPDYLSTRYAKDLKRQLGRRVHIMAVQHHHAHIASCMAENNLDEKVIGVAFDGVGLGDDNTIWGAEFLLCDLAEYQRINRFTAVPMPGGDAATKNPWRMAISYLYQAFGRDLRKLDLPFFSELPEGQVELLIKAMERKINTPMTSSAGRLFDAVAALTGLCLTSSFHAEAPMRLEDAIDPNEAGSYPVSIDTSVDTISWIKSITRDIQNEVPVGTIAARFHNSVANAIIEVVEQTSLQSNVRKVVLSGGTFQNRYLSGITEQGLKVKGYQVYVQREVPANDGGIALGQLAIAAKRRSLKQKH